MYHSKQVHVIMIFAFVLILSSILHVEMLLKVTYNAYKCKYYHSLLHVYYDTFVYGEILKMGEKWCSLLSFLTFRGLFTMRKNYVDTSGTSHFKKVNFNPYVKLICPNSYENPASL